MTDELPVVHTSLRNRFIGLGYVLVVFLLVAGLGHVIMTGHPTQTPYHLVATVFLAGAALVHAICIGTLVGQHLDE